MVNVKTNFPNGAPPPTAPDLPPPGPQREVPPPGPQHEVPPPGPQREVPPPGPQREVPPPYSYVSPPVSMLDVDTAATPFPPEPPKSIPLYKIVVAFVTGLLSIVITALGYATVLSSDELARNPEGPLVVSIILTWANVAVALWIFTSSNISRPAVIRAMIPVVFAIIAGALFILYYAAIQAWKNGNGTLAINYAAVINSATVFSSLAGGSLFSYMLS